jgi:putative ubiquitin-RnfH superfamily antitoxin RatB of RatAB toxin-antitoxin module
VCGATKNDTSAAQRQASAYSASNRVVSNRKGDPPALPVEVTYAEPGRAIVKAYRLLPPANVADALRLAAADRDFLGVDIAHAAIGVFGRLAPLDQPLGPGGRVEIYRPLTVDPKSARRARAKAQQRRG